MFAAIVVLVAGVALAITQPGDLGGKETTDRASSSTTQPSGTGSTTGGTTGDTTPASVAPQSTGAPQSTVAPQSTTTPSGGATTTTRPAGGATTTTVAPGGLSQGGAGNAGAGEHPTTGGTSMLALGLVMIAAALALRRSATA